MNTIKVTAFMAAILLINTTGGTVISISEGAEGSLDASGETEVVFRPNKKQGPSYSIPYTNVTALGYGPHADLGLIHVKLLSVPSRPACC